MHDRDKEPRGWVDLDDAEELLDCLSGSHDVFLRSTSGKSLSKASIIP